MPIPLLVFAFALSSQPPPPIAVSLTPKEPTKTESLKWSPKGSKVALLADGSALTGSFTLGPAPETKVALRLSKTPGATRFDSLEIDLDGDGKLADTEKLTTTPKESNHKFWSSFSGVVRIAIQADNGGAVASRPYPIDLWYVEDPQDDAPELVLRWSRRGWHEGETKIGDKPAYVLITEMEMDGVFDQRDVWMLARERKDLFGANTRPLDGHAWLDGIAYRPTHIDPHGRSIAFEAFDPGISEADEAKKADLYAPDRAAPRAEKPVAFEHDYAAALARGNSEGKRVLVDFETDVVRAVHKMMDQLVYTAAPVVAAASGIVAVKVDGDERKDLVKQYGVTGYPTLVLIGANGKEVSRAVGYRSVAEVVAMLKP